MPGATLTEKEVKKLAERMKRDRIAAQTTIMKAAAQQKTKPKH